VSPCRVSTVCKTRDVAQSVNKNATNHALSTGTSKSGGSARRVWARRAPQASSKRLILGALEMPFRGGCARSTHEPRECLAAAPAFVAITTRSACSRTDATAAAPAAPQPPWEWYVGLRGSRRSEAVAPVSGGAVAGASAPMTAPAAGQRPLSLPLLPMPPSLPTAATVSATATAGVPPWLQTRRPPSFPAISATATAGEPPRPPA